MEFGIHGVALDTGNVFQGVGQQVEWWDAASERELQRGCGGVNSGCETGG